MIPAVPSTKVPTVTDWAYCLSIPITSLTYSGLVPFDSRLKSSRFLEINPFPSLTSTSRCLSRTLLRRRSLCFRRQVPRIGLGDIRTHHLTLRLQFLTAMPHLLFPSTLHSDYPLSQPHMVFPRDTLLELPCYDLLAYKAASRRALPLITIRQDFNPASGFNDYWSNKGDPSLCDEGHRAF